MKKTIFLVVALLAIEVIAIDAQAQNNKQLQEAAPLPPPPPPPPPPPAFFRTPDQPIASVPQQPPLPAVPLINQVTTKGNGGYTISVLQINAETMVAVKRKGRLIEQITLKEWLANKAAFEKKYGALPPPPPPPPPAPPAVRSTI